MAAGRVFIWNHVAASLVGGLLAVTPVARAAPAATTGAIAGRIKDVHGKGVKGAVVTVEGQPVRAKTAADGSFRLAGVKPGRSYVQVAAPSKAYLDGEALKAIEVTHGSAVARVEITLSGRPSDTATYVGMKVCGSCHDAQLMKAFDGSPKASAHSRFVTEGTSHMVYREKWPKPGERYLPRDPRGALLKVQDPSDGTGMVHVVLCTRGEGTDRQYLFKFYPEQKEDLAEGALDCSAETTNAVWIPVAATIGGEGNWGEGYVDPAHKTADRIPNFGEGKQRYMARLQDVPVVAKWMKEHGVSREGQKQDYLCFLPVYLMQDGTPDGSKALAKGEAGFPGFWQKSPKDWASPDNTLSRNCAGCHATGVKITTQNIGNEKAIVTDWEYEDLNVGCERCHGPGSDHARSSDKAEIITPRHLTALAANQLCGQCHASHDGKSQYPMGVFKPPYDERHVNQIGYGFFVPGIYDLATFYYNFDRARVDRAGAWKGGSFMTWPDQLHGSSHSMEYSELRRSPHWNNQTEKITCFRCHDAHTLDGGAASLRMGEFELVNAPYANNALCLACHAARGSFKGISAADVAALQLDAGRTVKRNGSAVKMESAEIALARTHVAKAVAKHMQTGAGMGGAPYTPDDPAMPVGSCTSCHMPKTGKLQDVSVDAEYHLDLDKNGKSAIAEGNVPSHVFDVVWPAQSAVLKNPDPSKGRDHDIMPNSCSKCHAFARISGDRD